MSNTVTFSKNASKMLKLITEAAKSAPDGHQLALKLRQWAIEHSIKPEAVTELLKILRNHYPGIALPATYEGLMSLETSSAAVQQSSAEQEK